MSRKAVWGTCKGCGGPVRSSTKHGYCSKNPECNKIGGSLRSKTALEKRKNAGVKQKYVYTEKQREANALFHKNHPWIRMWWGAKYRAERLNVMFTITTADIQKVWTEVCPVFGVPLGSDTGKIGRWSPSLDRIKPELGYVPGNIQILSVKANSMKQDASMEELRVFARWVFSFA